VQLVSESVLDASSEAHGANRRHETLVVEWLTSDIRREKEVSLTRH